MLHADPENDFVFLNHSTTFPSAHQPTMSADFYARPTDQKTTRLYSNSVPTTPNKDMTYFSPPRKSHSILSNVKAANNGRSVLNAVGLRVAPLTERRRTQHLSFRPLNAVGLSLSPFNVPSECILSGDSISTVLTQYENLLCRQVLLGLVAYRNQPKIDLATFVEDVSQAGIRFVMLLPETASKMKSFANCIGIDTDWNCCISLQDPDETHQVLSPDENRSKLPQGISSVRNHLENIDDVPLLISLFSDCVSSTSEEMIRILQEKGGVVCVIGNSLHADQFKIFCQSDVSIALDPYPAMDCSIINDRKTHLMRSSLVPNSFVDSLKISADQVAPLPSYSSVFEYAFASSLHSLPTMSLNWMSHTPMHHISAVLAQSRVIYRKYTHSLLYCWSSYMLLLVSLCISNCINTPCLFTSYQVAWLIIVIIPSISISLLFGKPSGHEMKLMPGTEVSFYSCSLILVKNENLDADIYLYVKYFIFRFIPSSFVIVGWSI